MDFAQQGAHPGLVEAGAVVEARVGVLGDEVEGNRASSAFIDVHDVIEAPAVWVVAVVAAPGVECAVQGAGGLGNGAAFEQIGG
ncbi:hypothetical protein CKO36_14580 [Rhabdochromatium marinum]|nr:hypothetical protein [Rhabdochromatium marinum]